MSVVFIGAAIWASVHPYNAFWALATIVGLLLSSCAAAWTW
jgi:hypothetical protein